jgi:Uma2 family endonuclease
MLLVSFEISSSGNRQLKGHRKKSCGHQWSYDELMGVGTLISLEEYLNTTYRPDCDFVEGQVLERNAGKPGHGYAQGQIVIWFGRRTDLLRGLMPFPETRLHLAPQRVRIPDVMICELPKKKEEAFNSPPYLCVEIMSPDDTMSGLQERLDEYLAFGVTNVWVIDPWKHRGWSVTDKGWATATDGIMRTADGRVAMPLADVLLP